MVSVNHKRLTHHFKCFLFAEHQNSSSLDLVGEQVWRGALFLADFILHNFQLFKNANVLEVASGVGLTSIVAGLVAKNVITTGKIEII